MHAWVGIPRISLVAKSATLAGINEIAALAALAAIVAHDGRALSTSALQRLPNLVQTLDRHRHGRAQLLRE
ncbi:hypothetical protein PanNE5_40090 [Pandoraea sp. NE5]|nr:hypothetical protein PanNE5_40090 [Pandoraea sp. NE5]